MFATNIGLPVIVMGLVVMVALVGMLYVFISFIIKGISKSVRAPDSNARAELQHKDQVIHELEHQIEWLRKRP